MRIVGGIARGRTFEAPEGKDTRPTLDRVRENLFNILQLKVRGRRVLDLFAGSGALSLEAISRGAASAVLADIDPRAVRVIRQNVTKLGFADQVSVICAPWQQALRQLQAEGRRFDLVFLDPPYAFGDLTEILAGMKPMLEKDALIVIEHRSNLMPLVPAGFDCFDTRRYGIAGISFYRLEDADTPEGEM